MPLRYTERSIAGRMYPKLKTKPEPDQRPHPVDGWAKQRAQWGETDHRARGFVSPLGGTVSKRK